MPTLKYFPPQGGPREYSVHKAVTTIGRALDNDLSIPSHDVADHHANIIFDGRDFNLEEGDDRGVVLLTLADQPVDREKKVSVRAVRNVSKESITDERGGVSDSIVRSVLSTAKPVIVSDALADTTFGKSESVVALQLSSVMCAPLLSQGEVIGPLYR